MKLPWDSYYLKISFHVIFTLIVVYILTVFVDLFAYFAININDILNNITLFVNKVLSVFSPLLWALLIAYLCDPLVDFFQEYYNNFYNKKILSYLKKKKMQKYIVKHNMKKEDAKRTEGAAILYIVTIASIIILTSFIISKIGGTTLTDLESVLNTFIERTTVSFDNLYTRLQLLLVDWGVKDYISEYIESFFQGFKGILNSTGKSLVSIIASIGSSILSGFISLVLAFYIMKDKALIKVKTIAYMELFIPKKINTFINNLFYDIHRVFSGYIRGQLTDALIMAVLISVYLSIIRVEFGIIIGMISGFSNLIPYFGAIIGFVLAVLVALVGGDPAKALYAAIGLLVLQQIDSIFIVPKIVGEAVKLSPAIVLLSLAVGGELFGVVGMMLAVPICAILQIFISRYIEHYKKTKAGYMNSRK